MASPKGNYSGAPTYSGGWKFQGGWGLRIRVHGIGLMSCSLFCRYIIGMKTSGGDPKLGYVAERHCASLYRLATCFGGSAINQGHTKHVPSILVLQVCMGVCHNLGVSARGREASMISVMIHGSVDTRAYTCAQFPRRGAETNVVQCCAIQGSSCFSAKFRPYFGSCRRHPGWSASMLVMRLSDGNDARVGFCLGLGVHCAHYGRLLLRSFALGSA